MDRKLQEKINKVDWEDKDSIIRFYENNSEQLANFDLLQSKSRIIDLIDIKFSYISALFKKNHYTKAYHTIKEVDVLIQKINGSKSYPKLKEKYLFTFGMIAHNLKKYEESQEYFSQLIKLDPDNDLYKEWYEANKDWMFAKNSDIVGWGGFILLILVLSSEFVLSINSDLKLILEILSLTLMLLGFNGNTIRKFIGKYKVTFK